jgi:hypothetical protein
MGESKMTKYPLSISTDYVPGWTVVDAVRELFQNALDQQTTVPDNKMFFDYEQDQDFGVIGGLEGTLTIGNKSSVLHASSLLLGASTKANDPNTIGQFGEGYKIACLVLLRLGKEVTFYNYGAKEVWRPRFVQSRKYGAKILQFEVDKKFMWRTPPSNNLTIVVEGITPDEYEAIVDSNLHLQQELGDVWETPKGWILMDDRFSGKVYVNGLYICDHEPYEHGYDFKPAMIRLDRDRKLVSTFDLEWLSSEMWTSSNDPQAIDMAAVLARMGAVDVKFVTSHNRTNMQLVATKVYETFTEQHGDNAVPVSTNEEMIALPSQYKAVIVPEKEKELILASPDYIAPEIEEPASLRSLVEDWLDEYQNDMPHYAASALANILENN